MRLIHAVSDECTVYLETTYINVKSQGKIFNEFVMTLNIRQKS
jgi:hypothetical protein